MELFSIACSTCRARLKVVDPAAIGQILGCPKCGSMVQVTPPTDWQPAAETVSPALPTAATIFEGGPPAAESPASVSSVAAGGTPPAVATSPRWILRTGTSAGVLLVVSVAAAVLWSSRDRSPQLAHVTDPGAAKAPTPVIEPTPAEPPAPDRRWPPYEEGTGVGAQGSREDALVMTALKPPAEPEIGDQRSEVGDQKSEVRGQKSGVGGQISDLKSQISNPSSSNPQPSTLNPQPSSNPQSAIRNPQSTDPQPSTLNPQPFPIADPAIIQNIESQLATPIPAIEFNQVPLTDLVDLLKDLTALPISIDLPGLAEVGVAPDDRVSAHLTSTTVAQVLDESLAPLKLGFVVDQRQVLITNIRRQRDSLSKVEYAVSDLAPDDQALQELAGLCMRLVEPSSWEPAGGKGTIEVTPSGLTINQNRAVHRQLQQMCAKLRLARGLTQGEAPGLTLNTRTTQARQRLERPVSANFLQETPLDKVLVHLQRSTSSIIVVDSIALADAGLSPETTTTLKVVKQPLSATLTSLLEPLGLSWRAVDDHTFQVTTQAAAAVPELEFHAAADLLGSEQTAAQLVERIGQALPAAGDAGLPGPAVHFDQSSGYLLVLAPQRDQVQVESLLNSWRTPADPSASPKLELK